MCILKSPNMYACFPMLESRLSRAYILYSFEHDSTGYLPEAYAIVGSGYINRMTKRERYFWPGTNSQILTLMSLGLPDEGTVQFIVAVNSRQKAQSAFAMPSHDGPGVPTLTVPGRFIS